MARCTIEDRVPRSVGGISITKLLRTPDDEGGTGAGAGVEKESRIRGGVGAEETCVDAKAVEERTTGDGLGLGLAPGLSSRSITVLSTSRRPALRIMEPDLEGLGDRIAESRLPIISSAVDRLEKGAGLGLGRGLSGTSMAALSVNPSCIKGRSWDNILLGRRLGVYLTSWPRDRVR